MKEHTRIERAIKKEQTRLQTVFVSIPDNQKTIAAALIERAAFMYVTLQRMEQSLNAAELVDAYQNGEAQVGMKQSAELQGYNALIKNYATVMRQLSGMLPKVTVTDSKATAGNQLMELLRDKHEHTRTEGA